MRGFDRIFMMLLLALGATDAVAGAWTREQGGAFVALGYEATTPRSALSQEELAVDPSPELIGYTTLYAEYGLTDVVTIGVDAGRDEGPQTWAGVVFARVPIAPLEWSNRFAVQVGVGQRRYIQPGPFYPQETRESEAIGRLGLAWGRGFTTAYGGGWLGLEGSVEHRLTTDDRVLKLDAIAGFRSGEKTSLILQIQSGDFPEDNPYAKILPGVVRELWPGISLETSLIAGVAGDDRLGLRAGLWLEF